MLDGKKATSEKIVYDALAILGERSGKNPIEQLEDQRCEAVNPGIARRDECHRPPFGSEIECPVHPCLLLTDGARIKAFTSDCAAEQVEVRRGQEAGVVARALGRVQEVLLRPDQDGEELLLRQAGGELGRPEGQVGTARRL